jgi:hypothetical protein
MCGDIENGSRKLNKAKTILNKYTSMGDSIYIRMIEASIELREEKFDMAKAKLQECIHLGTENQVESFCLERLADVKAWPSSEWQFKWPVIYCGSAYKSKDKLALHKALLFLGDVFIVTKDDETATNLYKIALDGFTQMDVHCSRAQCMLRLGDLANKQGHLSQAIDFWITAQPLFLQSLQAKDVAQVNTRLLTATKANQNQALDCNKSQSEALTGTHCSDRT